MRLTETSRMVLVRAEVFMDLPTDQMAAIRQYLEEHHSAAGETLFREGDESDKLYVVRRGTIRVQRTRDGVLQEIGQRGVGAMIGETALIDSSPRSARVICETGCDFFALSRESFYEILSKYPSVATRMLRVLTTRIRDIDAMRLQEMEEKNRDLEITRVRLTGLLQELETSNHRLEAALDYRDRVLAVSPHPMIVTDKGNIVRLVNPAALRLFDRSEWGNLWDRVKPVAPDTIDTAEAALDQGRTWTGSLEVFDASERVLLCRVTAAPIADVGDGTAARLWIMENLAEQTALEQQTIQRELLATKSEMAAEIAHDLNNFLAVLSGNAELLDMHLGATRSEKVGRCMANIRQSLERIRLFADNLLNSRQPAGQRAAVDLNSFLANQLAFLRPQKKFKKIVFTTDWAPDIPPVICDPAAMQQVFYNLILNAAEALAGTAGAHSTVWVETRHIPERGIVRLRIADDGPGIPSSLDGLLFTRRVSSRPTGHGFGLLTVARIVKEHGGIVSAGARQGGGAELTIDLPVGLPKG